MKYKVGDKVRIVAKRTKGMDPGGGMDKYLGEIMTISEFDTYAPCRMKEDAGEWCWDDEMIEGLAKEEKILKTREMVTELAKNPEKEFINIHPVHATPTHALIENDVVFFRGSLGDPTSLYYIGLDWEWEEFKKPVAFMEALEKVSESEGDILWTIKSDEPYVEIKSETLDVILARLGNEFLDTGLAYVLLNSEFYTED